MAKKIYWENLVVSIWSNNLVDRVAYRAALLSRLSIIMLGSAPCGVLPDFLNFLEVLGNRKNIKYSLRDFSEITGR